MNKALVITGVTFLAVVAAAAAIAITGTVSMLNVLKVEDEHGGLGIID